MAYRVRILRPAQEDLVRIQTYAARDAPGRAEKFREEMVSRIESLGEHPRRGSLPTDARLRERGFRYLVHGEYLVFYKVRRSKVVIHRVLHGRRRYLPILR